MDSPFMYSVYFYHTEFKYYNLLQNKLTVKNVRLGALHQRFMFCEFVRLLEMNRHGHTNMGSGNENGSDVFDARNFGAILTTLCP